MLNFGEITMKISQNCIDLIKKWEGCKLSAYRCPAGVWTIGYGTTVYPDGRKVQIGDRITDQQAEGFLLYECQEKANAIAQLISVEINQNQFDALVSFAYNVGIGAFKNSTLRRKLNQKDYEGAASEFKRWNKATINGVKQVLKGLTDRRKDEELLFRKKDGFGTTLDFEPSVEHSVTWLKGYPEGEELVVVAYNKDKVVEIVTLKGNLKEDLTNLLNQYPKAKNFHIASVGEKIPDGERIEFVGHTQTLFSSVENPPTLERDLLIKGMSDEDAPGHDIQEMQERLKDLGYYKREIDGIFGSGTDDAVRSFQADVFGSGEADGKVGPKTWAKLWGIIPPMPPYPPSQGTYLRLTKTNRKYRYGLYILILEYIKNGKVKDSLNVCSGQRNKQHFRKGPDSIPMSMTPLPEGKWYINNIEWAGGKDKYYGAVFNYGIGPVTVPIDYKGPNYTRRSGIEIHIDWNHPPYTGTAGCVGIYTVADYKRFVTWLRDTDPRDLYVDWGLGSCPKPN